MTEAKPSYILIVDDNPANLSILTHMLNERGYLVRPAISGPLALKAVQRNLPDLVLLDILMPGMDGFEVCQHLKANAETQDIPVIFLSALNDVIDKVKAFRVGGIDYITKPFQVEEVLARVENHLALRQMREKLKKKNADLNQEIAERKRAETELQKTNSLLSELNRRLAELYGKMQAELNMARKIQESLQPPTHPAWPELDVQCYSTPAREIGGDFYAYAALTPSFASLEEPKRFAVAVGDVTGKGMPAALLMAVTVALFRSIVMQGLAPSTLLYKIDEALESYTQDDEMNCAFCYLEITPPQQGWAWGTARMANGGLIPPFLKRCDGSVSLLDVRGPPLGVGFRDLLGYPECTIDLAPGDSLILISDGALDAKNERGELFGFERLEATLTFAPAKNAQMLLNYLKASIGTFVGKCEPNDDITIVVIQV